MWLCQEHVIPSKCHDITYFVPGCSETNAMAYSNRSDGRKDVGAAHDIILQTKRKYSSQQYSWKKTLRNNIIQILLGSQAQANISNAKYLLHNIKNGDFTCCGGTNGSLKLVLCQLPQYCMSGQNFLNVHFMKIHL